MKFNFHLLHFYFTYSYNETNSRIKLNILCTVSSSKNKLGWNITQIYSTYFSSERKKLYLFTEFRDKYFSCDKRLMSMPYTKDE